MNDDQALHDFVAKYASPYDPASDDYDRPPFAIDVRSPGRSSFYNFHYYLTKVPPESIVGLLLHYTMPGDVVLDPFCGSGMTGVACQMCASPDPRTLATVPGSVAGSRVAIMDDLSPAACHISANYTCPAEAVAVQHEFECISARVAETSAWLYGTEHYEPAIGLYDPNNPAVAERLKNLSQNVHHDMDLLEGNQEKTWEVVDREEVERSLGFPISKLLYTKHGESVDLANGATWIRIPATLIYTVWSDVYQCEGFKTIEEPTGRVNLRTGKPVLRKRRVVRGCKGDIIARGAVDKQDDDGNNAFIRCPNCSERWMKGRVPRTQIIPVEVCYEYQGLKVTGGVPRPRLLRATRPVSSQEQERIREIGSRPVPYWYPNFVLNKDGPRYRRDSLAGKLVERYPDFFTHRNLWAIASDH